MSSRNKIYQKKANSRIKMYACFLLRSITTAYLVLISTVAYSQSLEQLQQTELNYQTASQFTYLDWSESFITQHKISLLPIENRSGIPIQQRKEKPEYYDHGKIPKEIDQLFANLVNSSQGFNNVSYGDYQMSLVIHEYQMPYNYAPDDKWWLTVKDSVDRWLIEQKTTELKLSLSITSGKRAIRPWRSTATVRMTHCDLNAMVQPLGPTQNENQVLRNYQQSIPGQAFISASNYLLIQALKHLAQTPQQAKVISKNDNEILVRSDHTTFSHGQRLPLFQSDTHRQTSLLPVGELLVVKTYQNQAVAYPATLRADQVRVGDWVSIQKRSDFTQPKSKYLAKNTCAPVVILN